MPILYKFLIIFGILNTILKIIIFYKILLGFENVRLDPVDIRNTILQDYDLLNSVGKYIINVFFSIRNSISNPFRLDNKIPSIEIPIRMYSLNLSAYTILSKMFRVKATRRNVKRAVSPLRPAIDISGAITIHTNENTIQTEDIAILPKEKDREKKNESLEKNMVNFFEAESAAVSLSKPWLRLERGLRLQKYRAFAEAYPGLNKEEKESLYKVLMKANDAKLLNTKQQIQYEHGTIQSIKGLKITRVGDPTINAVFKIDVTKGTKKNTEES